MKRLVMMMVVVATMLMVNAKAEARSNWELSANGHYGFTLNKPALVTRNNLSNIVGGELSMYYWLSDTVALNFWIYSMDNFLKGDSVRYQQMLIPLLASPLGIHARVYETDKFSLGIEGGARLFVSQVKDGSTSDFFNQYFYVEPVLGYHFNDKATLNLIPRYQLLSMGEGDDDVQFGTLHYMTVGLGFSYRF